jgi:tRNA(fMet)-specific endonuclease VapC
MGQRSGRPISPQDAWIAATAKRYGIGIITHNPSDFEPISDLQIISVID